jgi:hypothetical protein
LAQGLEKAGQGALTLHATRGCGEKAAESERKTGNRGAATDDSFRAHCRNWAPLFDTVRGAKSLAREDAARKNSENIGKTLEMHLFSFR